MEELIPIQRDSTVEEGTEVQNAQNKVNDKEGGEGEPGPPL